LSDKYDRDRRALSSLSQMRPKDRDQPGSTVASQSQQTTLTRSNQPRTGRERPENGRRDHDDRERPRSRVRDSSRTVRDGSSSKREKDDRRADRDDGYGGARRDKEDRDRDLDRDSEPDDPRRWRDDGKRDERIAARRDRESRERERERDVRDRRDRPAWDGLTSASDRRWADDRDNRGKRPSGRDRKAGDETKDREDRKDREREKEPAWMDTYIPSNSNGGVIGGQHPGGELDGIQAFRKEMRQKDKSTSPSNADLAEESQAEAASPPRSAEGQLDEIQLFRLTMKREEEKKKSDSPLIPESSSGGAQDLGPEARVSVIGANLTLPPSLSSKVPSQTSSSSSTRQPDASAQIATEGVNIPPPVLSTSPPQPSVTAASSRQEHDSTNTLKRSNSRLFSSPLSSNLSAPQPTAKPSVEAIITSSHLPQSHPPAGSRLLALGSRTPHNAIGPSARSASSQSPVSFAQKNGAIGLNAGMAASVNLNPHAGEIPSHFSPTVESVRVNTL
ncbi:hypothetical protein BU15DRAFT_66723, partial [Melanogaster broomeanus]